MLGYRIIKFKKLCQILWSFGLVLLKKSCRIRYRFTQLLNHQFLEVDRRRRNFKGRYLPSWPFQAHLHPNCWFPRNWPDTWRIGPKLQARFPCYSGKI